MHINDLPVEILGEIFEAATLKGYLTPNKFVLLVFALRPGFAPFNLIHVCRLWRDVAFSLLSLWTHLNGVQHEPLQPRIPAMTYWLECSQDAALHFRLSAWEDSRGTPFDAQHSRRMLRVFSKHVHRWRSLSIDVGDDLLDDLSVVLQEAAVPPPLEGLEIEFEHEDIAAFKVDKLASLLHNLDSLTRVHWVNPQGCTLPDLPWRQLKMISIKTLFEPEEVLECLAQCVSATSVSIIGWQDPAHALTLPELPHITLETLTSLTLNKSSDPLPMLSCFTLPSLEYLEVGVYKRDFDALERFVKRSKCPLKTLIVIDTTFQSDDIADFFAFEHLKAIPNVKLGPAHFEPEMLKLMKLLEASGARNLPPLVVWKEWHSNWPFFVGWKESGRLGARYIFENGKVTRTR
ncbi:hypothetical protein CVT26_008619 [Gymnopilus dilepis]|uniref:Uncharacterized protein n=1 Tax=Gymnopilus dilepis TaxID=231916 RepID=A0A409XXU2_9AGAR|nr:hypothetical protein CVT26_008619 [Gymnopilus dilepis]